MRRPASIRFPTRAEFDDERVLIGFTAGVLWAGGAAVSGVAETLPGSQHEHLLAFTILEIVTFLYGMSSMVGIIDWRRVPLGGLAIASATLLPLLAFGIWLTGGKSSYIQPLTIFVLVWQAYFFPLRLAIPLVTELVLVYASPLFYEKHPTAYGFPGQVLTFAVGAALVTFVLRMLKSRLMEAEEHQRQMANSDQLTGLVNRRGFDNALNAALLAGGVHDLGRRTADTRPDFVLLVFDLDGFKEINDSRGHPAGDRLLRRVATLCADAVRPGDTLARIGGDEFAVIAPGAGREGAGRLADALRNAATEAGVHATVAWAVHPDDGVTADELLLRADQRLYDGKARAALEPVPWEDEAAW